MIEYISAALFLGTPDVCRHFDRFLEAGVPPQPLRQALKFFEKNVDSIPVRTRISIADYTQRSDQQRFFLIDLVAGTVQRDKVSHGSGAQGGKKRGDPEHDGMLNRCQYRGNQTNMTRSGFFRTAELYTSYKHRSQPKYATYPHQWPPIEGRHNGLRLDGLTPGLNEHARQRGVVMHGAWYNYAKYMGRSYGCPAFTYERAPEILKAIRRGTLFFAYTGNICPEALPMIEAQVAGWTRMCPSSNVSEEIHAPRR